MSQLDLNHVRLRERARQCRQLASIIGDEAVRKRLIAAAIDYDVMANKVVVLSPKGPVDLAERLASRARLS